MLFDLSPSELEKFMPDVGEPADFDAFWKATLAEPGTDGSILSLREVETGLKTVRVRDLSFAGWRGSPVKAWYIRPAGEPRNLPCIVEYLGYGGGRGEPWDWLLWSAAGYAHLVMDTRGQGGGWLRGDTPDDGGSEYGPSTPGFMTRGIFKPETYYYRRLIADAAMATHAAARLPEVDASRIGVTGMSQGGGLAIAAAGLSPLVRAAAPDVPFLCHFRRATEITDAQPYAEIVRFLHVHYGREKDVFRTLSYFDGVSFARRAAAPALFSAASMDTTCPPSTVYAAHNAWKGEHSIRLYKWNGHEGGASAHVRERMAFFARTIGADATGGSK